MSTMATSSPSRYRLTADEYRHMGEAGILRANTRVELIDGDLIDMPPIGSRHAAAVELLADLLRGVVGEKGMVRTQQAVLLDAFSVPQPDLSVVNWRDDYYRNGHPEPGDLLLIVEIAETSVAFDRDEKTGIYARAGAPEYWLVDLSSKRVARYRSPRPSGYAESSFYGAADNIEIDAFPGSLIGLGAVLAD